MTGYPIEFIAIVCCLLAAETIVGVSLNLFIVLKWIKESKKNVGKSGKSGMHFITTLKTMDLIICVVVIPFTFVALLLDQSHNVVTCFIKEGLIMFASSGSSICVLLVSLDRYSAVVRPLQPLFSRRRIKFCNIFVFMVAIAGLFLPCLSLLMGAFETGKVQSRTALPCRYVVWVFRPYYIYDIYYVISFIVALCVVFLCYRAVLKVVRRRIETRTSSFPVSVVSEASNDKLRKQELKATRITFGVVMSFLICWGPHVIITIVQLNFPDNLTIDMVQVGCLFLAFFTPVIHPLIYTYETGGTTKNMNSTIPLPLVLLSRSRKITPEQTNADSDDQTFSFHQNINTNILNVTSIITNTSSGENTV